MAVISSLGRWPIQRSANRRRLSNRAESEITGPTSHDRTVTCRGRPHRTLMVSERVVSCPSASCETSHSSLEWA